jgi:hypothetical protein
MSVSTKSLAVLALAVIIAPLAALAHNESRGLMHPSLSYKTPPNCWTTNFDFQAVNLKPPVGIDVQKGFWPPWP